MLVVNPVCRQRSPQLLFIELRTAPRAGIAADVGENLDRERSQRFDKLFNRPRRVTTSPEFNLVCEHDVTRWMRLAAWPHFDTSHKTAQDAFSCELTTV